MLEKVNRYVNEYALASLVLGFLACLCSFWDFFHSLAIVVVALVLYFNYKYKYSCIIGVLLALIYSEFTVANKAILLSMLVIGSVFLFRRDSFKNIKTVVCFTIFCNLFCDLIMYTYYLGYRGSILALVDVAIAFLLMLGGYKSFAVVLDWRKKGVLNKDEIFVPIVFVLSFMLGCYNLDFFEIDVYSILAQIILLVVGLRLGYAKACMCGLLLGLVPSLVLNEDLMYAGVYAFLGLLCGVGYYRGKIYSTSCLLVGDLIYIVMLNLWQNAIAIFSASLVSIIIFILYDDITMLDNAEFRRKEFGFNRDKNMAFKLLANSISVVGMDFDRAGELDKIYIQVYTQLCNKCKNNLSCWQKKEKNIKEEIAKICDNLENGIKCNEDKKVCINYDTLLLVLKGQLMLVRMRKDYAQNWKLTKKVLSDSVSKMGLLADGKNDDLLENAKRKIMLNCSLKKIKVHFIEIDIDSEEIVNIGIALDECTVGKCGEVLCEVVEKSLERRFEVVSEECNWLSDNRCRIKLKSIDEINVRSEVLQYCANDNDVCGDVWARWNIDDFTEVIVLCDGMGNGKVAFNDSTKVIELLKVMLPFMVVKEALKLLNNWLLLDDGNRFISVDVVVIDKLNLKWCLYKMNGAVSYWKKNDVVEMIEGISAPIGILNEINIFCREEKICVNDKLILVSDGVSQNSSEIKKILNEKVLEKEKVLSLSDNNDDKSVIVVEFEDKQEVREKKIKHMGA